LLRAAKGYEQVYKNTFGSTLRFLEPKALVRHYQNSG